MQVIVGAPRDGSCPKTLAVFVAKLSGISRLQGQRLLDVGCGDGTFTTALGERFEEVYGIDVQEQWLEQFRRRVAGDPKFKIFGMSASEMTFPDNYFDTLVSIETLEHIPDLTGAIREFARVLRPAAECVITCPNRLFPFENHGIRWSGKEIPGRFPLLPYLPPLHDRFALARVFTVRSLDAVFLPNGFVRAGVDYVWPTFEHGGNVLQPMLKPLFRMMRRMETSSLRMFGTSILAKYLKKVD